MKDEMSYEIYKKVMMWTKTFSHPNTHRLKCAVQVSFENKNLWLYIQFIISELSKEIMIRNR